MMEKNLAHHVSLLQFVYAVHACNAYEYAPTI